MLFADGSFDVVLCQMALMFFSDRAGALREMARVARPGGTVALCVPAALDDQPAYGPFVELAVEVAGDAVRPLLGTYWACGDVAELTATCTRAGLDRVVVETHLGTARFGSPDELAVTEIEASPLAGRLEPAAYARIRARTREVLAPFTGPDRRLAAPLRAHVVVARAR